MAKINDLKGRTSVSLDPPAQNQESTISGGTHSRKITKTFQTKKVKMLIEQANIRR